MTHIIQATRSTKKPVNSAGGKRPGALATRAYAQVSLTGVKPVQRVNLVMEVADRLREEILAGRFGSNGPLPSAAQLVQTLGVSRTVVREAMRILTAQGLVEVNHGRQPRVKPANPESVIESLHTFIQRGGHSLLHVVKVRRALETEITAEAAELATLPQIEAMEEAIKQLATARKLDDCVEADMRFHDLLAEATGNPVFQLLLATLANLTRESVRETLTRSGVESAAAGHRVILAGVRRRDADAARKAMLDHLRMAEEGLCGERGG